MKKAYFLSLAMVMGMAVNISTARADDFIDTEKLAKDLNNDGTLDTTVVPLFKVEADGNGDGVPDRMVFWFNVYPIGSNTKTLETGHKLVALPANPCSNPTYSNFDFRVKFLGLRNTVRSHALIETRVECQESGTLDYKEAYKTTVYSANLSTGTGVWVYYVNRWAIGLDGIDTDGDGISDTLQLLTGFEPAADNENVNVRLMNPSNGAEIASSFYPVVRP